MARCLLIYNINIFGDSMPSPVNSSTINTAQRILSAKDEARVSFRGATKFEDMSVQEMLDSNPTIRRQRQKIESLDASLSKKATVLDALDKLRTKVENFHKQASYLRKPSKIDDNAFARRTASITTTDIQGPDYVSVTAKPGSPVTNFSINVRRLATTHKITVGTADLTDATAVSNLIQDAVVNAGGIVAADLTELSDKIEDDVGHGDVPTNSYAYNLYLLAMDAHEDVIAGRDPNIRLFQLKADAAVMFSQMELAPVSHGLASLATAAVGAGNLFQVKQLAIFNGEWGLDEINENIVQPASDAQAALGATALSVKTAAYAAFNALAAESPRRNDAMAKFVFAAVDVAASSVGATAASVSAAATTAFNQYKAQCTINLVNGDSLQTVIDKINTTTAYSGITAIAIETDPGSVLIELSSQKTGTYAQVKFYNIADNTKFDNFGAHIVNAGSVKFINLPGDDSISFIDHFPIVRNYNSFDYGGATITLNKANSNMGASQNVTVSQDTDTAFIYIKDLVDSYNALSLFIAEQAERDPTNSYALKESAILGNNNLLKQIDNIIRKITTTYLSGNRDGFRSLPQIGIGTEMISANSDNKTPSFLALQIDEQKLRTAITSNYVDVQKLFEFSSTSASPALHVIKHEGYYPGGRNFTVGIQQVGGLGPAANKQVEIIFTDAIGNPLAVPQEYYSLSGAPGAYTIDISDATSLLYGMSLSYASNIDNIVGVSVTQGIADQLSGLVRPFVDNKSFALIGSVSKEQESLSFGALEAQKEIVELREKLKKLEDRKSREIGFNLARADKAKFATQMMKSWLEIQADRS